MTVVMMMMVLVMVVVVSCCSGRMYYSDISISKILKYSELVGKHLLPLRQPRAFLYWPCCQSLGARQASRGLPCTRRGREGPGLPAASAACGLCST